MLSQSSAPVITIDGTCGAGKGTIAKLLAQKLQWHYLDSGAIYRLLAIIAQRNHCPIADDDRLAALSTKVNAEFLPGELNEPARVIMDGEDLTSLVRQESMAEFASQLAAIPKVRNALLEQQRTYRKNPGLVTDGRDMGTVIFPDANMKFYLTASLIERAKRRERQLLKQGVDVTLHAVQQEIAKRDERDLNRKTAPLKAAEDAIYVDTTSLDINDVFGIVWNKVSAESADFLL